MISHSVNIPYQYPPPFKMSSTFFLFNMCTNVSAHPKSAENADYFHSDGPVTGEKQQLPITQQLDECTQQSPSRNAQNPSVP
jgi:hypothetical protein